jgi:hypothetical protein
MVGWAGRGEEEEDVMAMIDQVVTRGQVVMWDHGD